MVNPKRIQRKRTKGWRKPLESIIVDRTSRWGNRFKVGDIVNGVYVKDNAGAKELYRRDLMMLDNRTKTELLRPLKGKNLVCFCALDQPCHADVLIELANQ